MNHLGMRNCVKMVGDENVLLYRIFSEMSILLDYTLES